MIEWLRGPATSHPSRCRNSQSDGQLQAVCRDVEDGSKIVSRCHKWTEGQSNFSMAERKIWSDNLSWEKTSSNEDIPIVLTSTPDCARWNHERRTQQIGNRIFSPWRYLSFRSFVECRPRLSHFWFTPGIKAHRSVKLSNEVVNKWRTRLHDYNNYIT